MRRLVGKPPVSDLFGVKGRNWLAELELPVEEHETVEAACATSSSSTRRSREVERLIAPRRLSVARDQAADERARGERDLRGDVPGRDRRYPPVSSSRASWSATSAWIPRSTSRASRRRRAGGSQSRARRRRAGRWSRLPGASCVSPARCTRSISASAPGAGTTIAIVATARKLACLFWCLLTRDEDYAHPQPSLTAKKLRQLEITRRRQDAQGQAQPGSAPPTRAMRASRARARRAGRGVLQADGPRLAGRRTEEGGRERDTGARITIGPRRAKSRGRPQAPDVCASLVITRAHHNLAPSERADNPGAAHESQMPPPITATCAFPGRPAPSKAPGGPASAYPTQKGSPKNRYRRP